MATKPQTMPIVTVVLVHGAWADGSSWNEVIARLQAEGIPVVSVQNPLSSLADDVAAVRRANELVDGPVVLVGHSWGGTVITQAGAVLWNGAPVNLTQLRQYLDVTQQMDPIPELHLQPEPEARYEVVDDVLAVTKQAKVSKMWFVGNEAYMTVF